jgi:hypothetical protein
MGAITAWVKIIEGLSPSEYSMKTTTTLTSHLELVCLFLYIVYVDSMFPSGFSALCLRFVHVEFSSSLFFSTAVQYFII